jgi:hypothetical protein
MGFSTATSQSRRPPGACALLRAPGGGAKMTTASDFADWHGLSMIYIMTSQGMYSIVVGGSLNKVFVL